MKYIYLDKEKAKQGVSLVYEVRDEPREGYDTYFEGKAVEFKGGDLPHFITYESETDSIRQASEEEKLNRGQRQLNSNEVLLDGTITQYNPKTQKIVDGIIKDKSRDDYILEGVITLKSEKEKARLQRAKELAALDILDAKVAVGRTNLTNDEKTEIDNWYTEWLDLPENYNDLSISIENIYPTRPAKINYYYK